MNKLLIIGRGQIGSALAENLTDYQVEVWSSDIDDLTSEAIERADPDAIINAAGKTNLAWCEENAREAMRSNTEAPVRLYQRVVHHNRLNAKSTRYIHFSSGCIWDGPYDEHGEPFQPSSAPTPACLYSWSKAAADAMLLNVDAGQVAILRPRQVYSDSDSSRNTLMKLRNYPKLVDTPNSMSSMRIIEQTLRHVIEAESEWTGIWNIYDLGLVTPFEVGEMLAREGLRGMPSRITKDELDQFHTPKRVDTVLYDERLERLVRPASVTEELHRAILGLKEKLNSQVAAA